MDPRRAQSVKSNHWDVSALGRAKTPDGVGPDEIERRWYQDRDNRVLHYASRHSPYADSPQVDRAQRREKRLIAARLIPKRYTKRTSCPSALNVSRSFRTTLTGRQPVFQAIDVGSAGAPVVFR